MDTPKPILITGATGNQGSAVIAALHAEDASRSEKKFLLLAVTRNVSSPAAQKLEQKYPGLKLVQGDLNAIPEIFTQAEKVLEQANHGTTKIWGVYSVQISMGTGVTFDSEIAQGTGLIDESITRGVQHLVYSSVDRGGDKVSWDAETPIPHFQSKHRIEHHLRDTAGAKGGKMSWTVLRPVAFMENLLPGMPTKVFLAAMRDTMGEKPNEWVSVVDIGRFAQKAFTAPTDPRYFCTAIGIAGARLTFAELDATFKKATGSGAPATYWVFGSVLMRLVKEVNLMLTWFATDGYGVDVEDLNGKEGVMDFETWLRERSAFVERVRGADTRRRFMVM
ncbi:NmrA family protein-like protein [Mytilinidion resinicola]|uniref:NmrA family protein-like protein n=1 Tax=Mytilinidion resinicola TaxID=574789 RepID=A0A6A6YC44_9PEZI|nr:NmrA family protein-like protein [Mytilinidion resinicola]KAF2806386.1 NmrA family protein-like protein [Mytilinidion resinicola]